MKFHYLLLALLVVTIASCGKDDDKDPVDTELTGKIRGVPFTYGAGRFIDFGPNTDGFDVVIFNEGPTVIDSCDANSDDVYVSLDVPMEPGKVTLSEPDFYVVFHHPDFFQNLLVHEGDYEILSINTTEMEIEFNVDRNADNFLKGKCTVYKCN